MDEYDDSSCTLIGCSCFNWRTPVHGLAVIDILLVILEAGSKCSSPRSSTYQRGPGTLYFLLWSLSDPHQFQFWPWLDPSNEDTKPLLVFLGPQLGTLVISVVFRCATMVKTTSKMTKQRFTFLGCCAAVYPSYSPLSILLNRSLSRPLVR
jgi:hypothetical protein